MVGKENKRLAAKLARQFLVQEIDFTHLIENYPKNTGDKNIDNLLNLIVDFPKVSGVFVERKSFEKLVFNVIEQLEK